MNDGFKFLRGHEIKTSYHNGLKVTLHNMGNKKLSVTLTYHGLPNVYERKGLIDMVGNFEEYKYYADIVTRTHKMNSAMSHWEIRNYLEDLYINFIS
jgi:hypothetical protein